MKIKNFKEKIAIPQGYDVKVDHDGISISKAGKTVTRRLKHRDVSIGVEEGFIVVSFKSGAKREKTMAGTFAAHIKNMIRGAEKPHVYKMKICSGHFPMTVSANGNKFIVNNFLGEKTPREMKIKDGATVKIEGDIITIESNYIEIASQIAADIERLTRVRGRDLRVFQDGIYITSKDGESVA
jgi:large subunit ribosomal protein L6